MAHILYILASAAWNDIFAVNDDRESGVEQHQYRHTAYRQLVLWQCVCVGGWFEWSQAAVSVCYGSHFQAQWDKTHSEFKVHHLNLYFS